MTIAAGSRGLVVDDDERSVCVNTSEIAVTDNVFRSSYASSQTGWGVELTHSDARMTTAPLLLRPGMPAFPKTSSLRVQQHAAELRPQLCLAFAAGGWRPRYRLC